MYRYRFIFIAILIFSIASIRVFCDEPETAAEPDRTEAVLLRIKNATSEIETLTGDFIQKKKIDILKDTPESKGKFYYKKPDCLRWEIIEPVEMGFIVNGTQGKKWRKKDDKVRKFDVSKEPIIGVISSQVFAWARGDFDKLKEGYEISILSYSPIEVKLLPRSSTEKKYISSIILRFSENDSYVEQLEINETKGGSTQITFYNMVTNKQLEEDIF
jgi:outer membrane lipoprotein-sorting protein